MGRADYRDKQTTFFKLLITFVYEHIIKERNLEDDYQPHRNHPHCCSYHLRTYKLHLTPTYRTHETHNPFYILCPPPRRSHDGAENGQRGSYTEHHDTLQHPEV